MSSRTSPAAAAVRALLGISVSATGVVYAAEPAVPEELPTVYVYATAIKEDPQKIASSFSVLEGQALMERTQGTLGDTLNGLPGVHVDSFGGGATRPVIRGQTAPRVTVLSDSSALLDASDISPDHAVTGEPMLVERIEVLRGPATLLYGSGATGGVINLLDGKVPTSRPEDGLDGQVAVRGSTAARERAFAGAMTAAAGDSFAVHLEGTSRQSEDYLARGGEERRIHGTEAESESASVGFSWVGSNGHLGLAHTWRDDGYGVPGHEHEYEECHPHGALLHCEPHEEGEADHDEEHEHEELPAIALASRRFDLRGEFREPFAGVEQIRLRASHTRYRHDELEGGEIGTAFRNKGMEARIEVQHVAVAGWRGVVGVQHSDSTFRSVGEEAFLPTVDTRSTGLFVVEHLELHDALHLELGARQEWLRHSPRNDPRGRPGFKDSATSFSGAVVWEMAPANYLTMSATRSGRLPHAQELYARGIHLATNTFECGMLPSALTCGGDASDAALRDETSTTVELSWRRTAGALTFALNGYVNDVDNYIHARTLDQFEDFRLIKYAQRDARFRGMELEATWQIAPTFAATVFGDAVRARFSGGEDLPRIPASRAGVRLAGEFWQLGGELEYYRVDAQKRIAGFETVTPGHDMLGITLRYRPAGESAPDVFLRGSNLLGEAVWNHSSYLADAVPLQGRSVSMGMRWRF